MPAGFITGIVLSLQTRRKCGCFLVTVVCGGLITAAGFVGRAFVDKNENGEPDIWEEERKDKHE